MAATNVILATQEASLTGALQRGLAEFDIALTSCHDLSVLYNAVQADRPEVVMFDAALPRLALEAAARFLRSKPDSQRIPILLLTGAGEDLPDPGLLAAATGADDFIDIVAGAPKVARVILRLASAAQGGPTAAETGELRVPGQQPGRPSVLVVDDDASIAHLLMRMLQQKYDVAVAHDGKAALQACTLFKFDAVFCDLMMPGLSGADVYRTLHASNPQLAERIVFVTAHTLETGEAQFFMGLKNHVIHKPFSMREVLAVAAHVVGTGPAAP